MYQPTNDAPKILFVDDDPTNIEIFKLNFGNRFEVHCATSGEEALAMYNDIVGLGIIVSDHRMPGMSGVELLSKLYAINPDTIRIIVTAFVESENVIDAINYGHIYQYVLKPWDPMQLGIVLEQGLFQWNLTNENRRLVEEQEAMNKKLRLLSRKLITAQEEERKRISMELHDDIGQNLVALKLQLGNLVSLVEEVRKDSVWDTISTLKETLQITIDNTRALSQNLSPAIIDEFGFDLALREFIDGFCRDYGMKVEAEMLPLEMNLTKEALHQVYRIFQEIFNNIGKHSGSDRINMTCDIRDETFYCEIVDFGCGFKDLDISGEERSCKRGLGLTTIRERVSVLGGRVKVTSSPNKGTQYFLSLPLGI